MVSVILLLIELWWCVKNEESQFLLRAVGHESHVSLRLWAFEYIKNVCNLVNSFQGTFIIFVELVILLLIWLNFLILHLLLLLIGILCSDRLSPSHYVSIFIHTEISFFLCFIILALKHVSKLSHSHFTQNLNGIW